VSCARKRPNRADLAHICEGIVHIMRDNKNCDTGNPGASSSSSSGSTSASTRRDTSAASEKNKALRPGEEGHMEVVEEQVDIGKREVEKGGVRVKRTVSEKPVEKEVTLREEKLNVERRPVDRPLAGADANTAFRESTVEVREKSEVPIVEKHARVIEEVVVGKDVQQRTEHVRETARRSDVEVEQIPGSSRAGATSFDAFDSDYRSNFASGPLAKTYSYEQSQPAYRYGYDLAGDRSIVGRDWNAVESDARMRWEQRNPGTWEKFKDSIRYAWERAKAKVS